MKVALRLRLAMLATLALAGCRTVGTGSIAHSRPPALRPRPTFDLDAFVAEHNQNAGRIQSLRAKPAITATMGPPDRARSHRVDGRLALSRPRSFELQLYRLGTNYADIGSNDEKFWFWVQNEKDRSVYYCNHDDLAFTTLGVAYQPEWIVEAMGLKPITADEAAQAEIHPGPQPGTSSLSFPPTRSGSQDFRRVMIVSDQTHKVRELRVLSADGKSLLAQATIKKHADFPAMKPDSDEPSKSDDPGASCSLPEHVVLEWKREQLALDVVLESVEVNHAFKASDRRVIFVEPTPPGCARVNLAELARQKGAEGTTAVRESLPVPESSSPARSIPPLQIRTSQISARSPRRRANQPDPASVMLLPVIDLDVVSAPVPRPPGTGMEVPAANLATTPGSSLER
jgi:hypothetical protein